MQCGRHEKERGFSRREKVSGGRGADLSVEETFCSDPPDYHARAVHAAALWLHAGCFWGGPSHGLLGDLLDAAKDVQLASAFFAIPAAKKQHAAGGELVWVGSDEG